MAIAHAVHSLFHWLAGALAWPYNIKKQQSKAIITLYNVYYVDRTKFLHKESDP